MSGGGGGEIIISVYPGPRAEEDGRAARIT